jgi:hypothetical protein
LPCTLPHIQSYTLPTCYPYTTMYIAQKFSMYYNIYFLLIVLILAIYCVVYWLYIALYIIHNLLTYHPIYYIHICICICIFIIIYTNILISISIWEDYILYIPQLRRTAPTEHIQWCTNLWSVKEHWPKKILCKDEYLQLTLVL